MLAPAADPVHVWGHGLGMAANSHFPLKSAYERLDALRRVKLTWSCILIRCCVPFGYGFNNCRLYGIVNCIILPVHKLKCAGVYLTSPILIHLSLCDNPITESMLPMNRQREDKKAWRVDQNKRIRRYGIIWRREVLSAQVLKYGCECHSESAYRPLRGEVSLTHVRRLPHQQA